jgi:hypothetical protein
MPFNADGDYQRTPTFSGFQKTDIPVPEKDILDPVAEYNRGEVAAMQMIESRGLGNARDYLYGMLDEKYETLEDFIQGYSDALELIATREI